MGEDTGLWKEYHFRLKEGADLDAVIAAFSKHFDNVGWGEDRSFTTQDLMSGRIKVVLARKGLLLAVIVFYYDAVDRWRVAIFADSPRSGSTEKFLNKLDAFFLNDFLKLAKIERESAELENQDATTTARGVADLSRLKFCNTCGAAIAIADSSYCWNCGTKMESQEKTPRYYGEEESVKPPQSTSVACERSCTVCKLGFKEGELLAWCPRCGRAAHRVHLLEWLHVKDDCPACGQHLEERDLEGQLAQAHLRAPRKTRTAALKKRGTRP
jgi:predicted RNA-binding Zn-ribbon protein involved in translation (DUF1610 family)